MGPVRMLSIKPQAMPSSSTAVKVLDFGC
jgi:hypothetical protein